MKLSLVLVLENSIGLDVETKLGEGIGGGRGGHLDFQAAPLDLISEVPLNVVTKHLEVGADVGGVVLVASEVVGVVGGEYWARTGEGGKGRITKVGSDHFPHTDDGLRRWGGQRTKVGEVTLARE